MQAQTNIFSPLTFDLEVTKFDDSDNAFQGKLKINAIDKDGISIHIKSETYQDHEILTVDSKKITDNQFETSITAHGEKKQVIFTKLLNYELKTSQDRIDLIKRYFNLRAREILEKMDYKIEL